MADTEALLRSLHSTDRPLWIIVAEAYIELEKTGSSDERGVSWARRIVNELSTGRSSLGINQIQKVVRVYRFLEVISKSDPSIYPRMMASAPMQALEIAQRLYSLDASAGLGALQEIIKGVGAAGIDALYKKVRDRSGARLDAKRLAILEHNILVERAMGCVEDNAARFIGERCAYDIISRAGKYDKMLVSVDFRLISDQQNERLQHGFDVLSLDPHKSSWSRHRARIAFAATFFTKYWLFISSEEKFVQYVADELLALDVDNAGVCLVGAETDGFLQISKPRDLPKPDRRALLG